MAITLAQLTDRTVATIRTVVSGAVGIAYAAGVLTIGTLEAPVTTVNIGDGVTPVAVNVYGGNVTAAEFVGDLTGNADTATLASFAIELETARAFALSGDITAPAIDFDGSGPVTLVTAIAAGVIVNADVNAAAAIAYGKLNLAGSIVNADVAAAAGIVDTKLATIATAGKVSNSATTATALNTASAIVARDGSGNFVAGTITAALTGNASTATALQNARTIFGVSFNGTANVVGAFTGATTGAFSSNVTVGGTLGVTGIGTFDGRLNAYAAGTTILNLRNAAATVDAREWSWRVDAAGVLDLRSVSDANTTQTTVLSIARAGGLTAATSVTAPTFNGDLNGVADEALLADVALMANEATVLDTARTIAITGDLTWTSPAFDGSGNVTAAGTLATVNANVGSFGSSTAIPTFTVNAKGLITAAATAAVVAPAGTLTGATLAAGVTASSLQTFGTVTILNVDNLRLDGNTLSSTTGALNITPVAGSAIVLDGTISVDAGVVTGATSISSTSFAGALTGNVTGNVSGSAATVTTAAQPAITSVGTLTVLQVDNLNLNGNTLSATTGAVNITPVAGSAIVLDGTISVDAGVVTGATSITSTAFVGTLSTAAQPNVTSTGTLTVLNVDNVRIDGNTISSTAGTDLLITPLAGQQLILDGTIVIDAGVVTGATSITSTSFVGNLTGTADEAILADVALLANEATALETPRTLWGQSFDGTGNVDGDLSINGSLTALSTTVPTLSLRYDGSNRLDVEVTSGGLATFTSLGGAAGVQFGQNLTVLGNTVLAALFLDGEEVTADANDSGGTGFRRLVVPNL
jgi:hypothetical protein